MIPSNTTLETITRARMEDRAFEAKQQRILRLASQAAAPSGQAHGAPAGRFGWLSQLVTRLTSAGA